ncbi:MAG: SDR family oxidoreductase [Coriobacteriia bacterium]|nr:SDR family oxidoreductase [Coriobacteriia bacterium]
MATGPLDGSTALVTGATSGIGLVTARRLAEMGADVVLLGRSPERLHDAADVLKAATGRDPETIVADFSRLDDVRGAARVFTDTHSHLDILVNNAGVINDRRVITVDGNEETFQVDHLAHFLLTHLLMGALRDAVAARVVNISSGAHEAARSGIDFADLTRERRYSAFGAYAEAKLANVLFTYELARRLGQRTSITSNAVHPGGVRSGFGAGRGSFAFVWSLVRPFLLTPEQGAETSVFVASSPSLDGVTGRYYHRSADTASSAQSHRADAASELWEVSERLTDIAGLPGGGAS